MYDYNFGLLSFAGPAGARTATLQLIDEHGAARTELKLAETDLRPQPGEAGTKKPKSLLNLELRNSGWTNQETKS